MAAVSNSPGDGVATLAQRLRDFPTEEDCGDPECGSCDFTRLCHSLAARVEALAASEQALRERVAELEQSLSKERRLYTAQVLLTTDLRTRLAAAERVSSAALLWLEEREFALKRKGSLATTQREWDLENASLQFRKSAAITTAPPSEGPSR